MGLKNLSGIVNGFMLKKLLLPAVIFIVFFSSFWIYTEIENIKKQQLYYAENIGYHLISYLKNCSDDLSHSEDHILESRDKRIKISKLIGFDTSFHTIYLLDERGRVLKSVDEEYYNQDFSGIVSNDFNPRSFLLTVPYYSDFAKKIVVGMVKPSIDNKIVLAELNLSSMESYINNISSYMKNGSVFLTDPFGNIIADIDMTLVKRQVNYGNLEIIKKLRDKKTISGFYKSFGKLELMSATSINPGNIKIVIHQDAFDICIPILFSTVFSLFVVCLIVFFMIASFKQKLSESVVKPISRFAGEIELFKSGSDNKDFLVNFSDTDFESFKELFDVREKFMEMQETIIKREEDLRESQKLYRGVVEDTPVLIGRFKKDGSMSFANKAYCDYFKKSSRDMTGANILDFLPRYQQDKFLNDLMSLTMESPTKTSEYQVFDSQGNIKWFWWTNRALFDENGNLATYHSIGEDITKRKEDEEKLAAEREQLSVTLRSIGDGVITTDIRGRVILVNKVAERLTGWTQRDAAGKELSEVFHIIHEETGEIHESPVEKVLASGEIVELANHTILISRTGKKRIIADSGAPIKDRKSKTIGVVLVFRDMTEKSKLQETMQRTAKIESLGVLAGGIAHDFNNLLGGVYGYIDLALEFSKDNKVSSFLEKSMETMDRAKNLASQLLTFSKGGAPVKKIGSLFPFVKEVVEFALSGSNVIPSFEVEEDLLLCNYDINQISQVIDNLVINAKQAMPDGGSVHIKAENINIKAGQHHILDPGIYIKLTLQDSGPGISKEFLDKIFDPFFTTKEDGHGIGLTTSYSIIEKHNGCIDVESALNHGTSFYIFLPASKDGLSQSFLQSPKGHYGQGRIIIMDDEDVILQITSEMLTLFGYKPIRCKNGKEAVAAFKEEKEAGRKVTALICDLTIPGGMGGLETVKEIRKIDINIPVFVSSGYSEDPIMHKPESYGFTASISKPFKRSELSKLLSQYLEN